MKDKSLNTSKKSIYIALEKKEVMSSCQSHADSHLNSYIQFVV